MTVQSNNAENIKTPKHLHRSFLNVITISLLVVVGAFFIFETVCRLSQFNSSQPIRSFGIFHPQFETKWFRLKEYVKQNGGVDVLLMGNSMVNTGIDPDVLVKEYETLTGIKLRIFNFGVEGLDLYTNSELAALLVQEFHPKTIIYFTEMREYGPVTDTTVPDRFKADSWFQYKLGYTSFQGWFFDHSYAMQYLLPYRNWSRADFPDTMLKDIFRYSQTTVVGYEPDHAYSQGLDVRTDPSDPAQKVLFDLYRDYAPDERILADFKSILELKNEGVQMMVTEMPIYKTYYDYFGGESVHLDFLTTLSDLSQENQALFIQPMDSDLIPLTGRMDNHHLNFEGAPLYSQYLGAELAQMCIETNKCLANEGIQ